MNGARRSVINTYRTPSCLSVLASSLSVFVIIATTMPLGHWLRLGFRHRCCGVGSFVRGRWRDRFGRGGHRLFQRNDGVPPDGFSDLAHGSHSWELHGRFHASRASTGSGGMPFWMVRSGGTGSLDKGERPGPRLFRHKHCVTFQCSSRFPCVSGAVE